jgi:DNA-binding protein HU-beta
VSPLEPATISRAQIAQAAGTAKSLTEGELAAQVAERAGLSAEQTTAAMEAVFAGITEALVKGDRVRIAGFGSFFIAQRAARTGRNPETGEAVQVPARKVARFKPAKALKEAIETKDP